MSAHHPNHQHNHAHGNHTHTHDHHTHGAPLTALLGALAVTGVVLVAELVGGWLSGSVALIADAMHMLSDAAGLIIAAIAVAAGKRAASARATYGYRRVEVFAALINAASVLAISIFICVEALRRLRQPAEIASGTMMAVAVAGLAANALSAWMLSRHRKDSINVQGAFLHVLVDILGSVAVIAAGLIIKVTGFTAADPIASLIIAALVLPRAWQLLRHSTRVLLEQVPDSFDVHNVEPALRAIDGVAEVHDLHLWSLDGVTVLATAHLTLSDVDPRHYAHVLDDAQEVMRRLGVDHATIQVEPGEHRHHESIC